MSEKSATADGTDYPGPARGRHFIHLDAMRAIAVLGVLIIHVGAASGANMMAWYGVASSQGRLGVRIFFMISAFLLYRPYVMAQLQGEHGPRLGTYAKRRVLRIFPAYWVALTCLAIWPGLTGVLTKDWWIYYGVLQSYFPASIFLGLNVAWSLTIEVTFYAVLPVLALLLGWLGHGASPKRKMQRQVIALILLGAAAEFFRIYVFVIRRLDMNFTLPSMFLPFAIGMLLAVSSAWLGTDERRWTWTRFVVDRPWACWLAAAVFFVASCNGPYFFRTGIGKHTVMTWALEQLAYVILSALLLLPAVFGEKAGGWPRRILANRFMAFTGTVSYGIFLWHQPLMRAMKKAGWDALIPGFPVLSLFIVCFTVSLFLGWASYRLIELPAMRLRGEVPKRIA